MEHIAKFPAESSHYSRSKNTNRMYLSSNLSISKMYELYREECQKNSTKPVSSSAYRNVFLTKFNLGFGNPRSDTCDIGVDEEHKARATVAVWCVSSSCGQQLRLLFLFLESVHVWADRPSCQMQRVDIALWRSCNSGVKQATLHMLYTKATTYYFTVVALLVTYVGCGCYSVEDRTTATAASREKTSIDIVTEKDDRTTATAASREKTSIDIVTEKDDRTTATAASREKTCIT